MKVRWGRFLESQGRPLPLFEVLKGNLVLNPAKSAERTLEYAAAIPECRSPHGQNHMTQF